MLNDLVLKDLYSVLLARKTADIPGSYTCYLFNQGLDKILKKCGEECTETIIAAKNGLASEIISESADLIYHLLVMLAQCNVDVSDVLRELSVRAAKQRNLKTIKTTDKDT
ncbi:MAG: phosphoribosyl-ATP diphosphatase [Christensenellaceae bacterium]|jgi:phosphoribosyl-ATP pyrophosphohydrolase|nr:phosphoribosyl-ATP diphosphatase [Christensenellaceae bacterium]